MKKYPLVAQIYIISISLAGFVVLALLAPTISHFPWFDFLVFVLLIALSEAVPVNLPRGGTVSMSFSVWYAGLILFGPAITAWMALTSAFRLRDFFEKKPLHDLHKYLFNMAQCVLSVVLAGAVFLLVGGELAMARGTTSFPLQLLPLILCAVTLFFANSILPTMGHALIQNVPFRNIWSMNIRPFIPNTFALAVLGIILAEIYLLTGPAGLVLIVIPLLVVRQTFSLYFKLRQVYLGTVKSLVAAIEAKDKHTSGHSERVSTYATKIARQMNLSEDRIEKLEFAALLHDIGKIGVSRDILTKSGRLTREEFKQVQRHPVAGAAILKEIDFLKESIPAVYHHHERVNGSGYVNGMKGKSIPLEARIIAVADSFDAMISARPHRPALSTSNAVKELVGCAGSQFDETVVRALLSGLELDYPDPDNPENSKSD